MLYHPKQDQEDAARMQEHGLAHALLHSCRLRPTRQRLAVAAALFSGEPRHVTADSLFQEMTTSDVRLSLATVYNTLNQFADAGLVRRIAINSERTYFDTDTGDHHHFYVEAEGRIIDIPSTCMTLLPSPAPLPGYSVVAVDVIVRLRSIDSCT